ncbi:MAG TPA: NAD(P)H-dependent glycerol-3-phosphate dehydrogenase [Candidatus Krumholzibacteriaceae bacterium]|nr:NAD(P)H-dependent glycerol-3-phosphate dehydrogenase [Candidatus Krumholzibacteriaceae bacterium]
MNSTKSKKRRKEQITVLGSGSWGTTIAILLNENGHDVILWEKFPELSEAIKRDHENKRFLPGISIPWSIKITSDLNESLEDSKYIVFVTPSHTIRNVARLTASQQNFDKNSIIIDAAKGLENKTLCRMSTVLSQELPQSKKLINCLLGPSHAEEVSRKMPTSVVAAGINRSVLEKIQNLFMTENFRVYTNTDIIGVELGVALKNTIAIAAGICDGLGYGDNTKAALITRGLAEIKRLAKKLGARKETLSGLSGIGDLIATCMSRHSRNRYVGEQIGKGKSLKEVLGDMVMVAEGVKTTKAAVRLGSAEGVELPIAEQVYSVLFHRKNPRKAMRDLMLRKAKKEMY